ncbi:MAG: phage portal protein family protein, partial [Opitutaceae bacterium]
MGTAAWGSFPAGTKLELVSGATPGVAGANEPTERLMSLADTACDRLFLGATLTTTAGDRGSYAMASVHREIELDLYENYAAYVIDVINNQLISSIVALNWGNTEELPFLEVELQRPAKDQALVERDRILFQEMRLPVSTQWLYDRHKVPAPGPGDDLYMPRAHEPTEGRDASPRRPSVGPDLGPCRCSCSNTPRSVDARSETTDELRARQAASRELLDRLLPLAESTNHRVVWTSTLDDRTTDYCLQMHGRAYRDGWTEPPPAHHNCRSRLTLVPEAEYQPSAGNL